LFFKHLDGYGHIKTLQAVNSSDNFDIDLLVPLIHLTLMTDTPDDASPDNETPDNETMREVKRAKARKEAAEDKSGLGWKTAAGIGIGSAALAAALIYASKARNKDD
jgi:hypothetical protein